MILDNLRYDQRYVSLLTVYGYKSYTLAAKELSLTPSAVSHQIHSIERELKVILFLRKHKGLVPTQECNIVVDNVRRIQKLCNNMTAVIDGSRRNIDRLTIGTTPSTEGYALTGMLSFIKDRMAPLQITIASGQADELCLMLENSEIDLAIIEGQCDTESFENVMIDTDRLEVAVPPDSQWAKAGLITVRQLLAEKLIMKPNASGTRTLFEASLKSAGISCDALNVIMEANNTDTIIRLVAGGYGLSVLSHKACCEYVDRGVISVVGLEGINMTRSIRMLCRRGEGMQNVIDTIRNYYNNPSAVD